MDTDRDSILDILAFFGFIFAFPFIIILAFVVMAIVSTAGVYGVGFVLLVPKIYLVFAGIVVLGIVIGYYLHKREKREVRNMEYTIPSFSITKGGGEKNGKRRI